MISKLEDLGTKVSGKVSSNEDFACIDEEIQKGTVAFYLTDKSKEERMAIQKYVMDKHSKNYICRIEYLARGAECKCCDVWYKSSKYGESWNGGHIWCDICGEHRNMDYDDYEDVMDDEEIRLSLYRPTGTVMICRKGYAYKRGYRCPFSFRKRFPIASKK